MTLTQSDLEKIKDVIDARANLIESRMASKSDLDATEARLSAKIDKRTEMIQGDQFEVGRDLIALKKLQPKVRKLEKQLKVKR
ncbi:MAG: hypothetical protein AAB701_01450 [Patescibacteria group bacterium]